MSHLTVKSSDTVIGTDAHTRKWKAGPVQHLIMKTDNISGILRVCQLAHSTCRANRIGQLSTAHMQKFLSDSVQQSLSPFFAGMNSRNLDTKNTIPRSDSCNMLLSRDVLHLSANELHNLQHACLISHQTRQTSSFSLKAQVADVNNKLPH